MVRDAEEVRRDALALPVEARADGAEEAWRVEIQQRIQEIDSGAVELIPWEDARRRLRARLER